MATFAGKTPGAKAEVAKSPLPMKPGSAPTELIDLENEAQQLRTQSAWNEHGQSAKTLVKHAPERMLWASNWPHPSARKPAPPKDEDLLDLLADWAPDANVQKRILADNPAELYAF